MSKVTKRKHIQRENRLQEYFAPPSETQSIVRILSSRGNNLHLVESADQMQYLVSMPTKFRKNIWVKRGDFVIVDPIVEGDKVKAEMVRVLSKEHIRYFKKINVWPSAFEVNVDTASWGQYQPSDSTTSSSSEFETDHSEEENSNEEEDEGLAGATSDSSESASTHENVHKLPETNINTDNGQMAKTNSGDISLDKIDFSPEHCVPSWP